MCVLQQVGDGRSHRAESLDMYGKRYISLNYISVAGKYAVLCQPREHTFGNVDTELESEGLLSCQTTKMLQFQGR